jgi:hypothetical protein
MAEAEQEQIRRLKHNLKLSGRRKKKDPTAPPSEARGPALFERSLKPKDDNTMYEWPRRAGFLSLSNEPPTSPMSDRK